MEQMEFNIFENNVKQQIEEYLLEAEKRHRGKKILFIIGQDVWDVIFDMYEDGKFSFENCGLRLECEDGVKYFEYNIDEGSSIWNGFKYSKMIRVFIFEESKDIVL